MPVGVDRNLWGVGPRLLLSVVSATLTTAALAADWPQYRGPNRDGRSSETGLLESWPDEGPQVLWRSPLGSGYSGIAVAGGRVFTLFGDQGEEFAAAFDAADGKELWRVRTDRNRRDGQGDGPRSTPTVDGDVVLFIGAEAKLYALAASSGEKRWAIDLPRELGGRVPRWGYSSSPLVEAGLLIVEVGGGPDHAFAAFDKDTGELVWHTGSRRPAYSSPLAVTLAGERQLIFFTADGLSGLSARDGQPLWHVPWKTSYDVNASMPVFVPKNGLFISTGYDTGAALFEVVREEGQVRPRQVWRERVMKNHFNSSVLVGQHIYGFDMGILKCIEARSGAETWRARGGFSKGSLLYADGHLIVLGGKGALGLVEANPIEFRRKAYAQILDSKTWTMPSLADGVLYVRDFTELLALRVGS